MLATDTTSLGPHTELHSGDTKLPITKGHDRTNDRGWSRFKFFMAGLLLAIIALRYVIPAFTHLDEFESPLSVEAVCPKTSAITPRIHADFLRKLEKEFATEEFHDRAFTWLGGAIKVPYVLVLLLIR